MVEKWAKHSHTQLESALVRSEKWIVLTNGERELNCSSRIIFSPSNPWLKKKEKSNQIKENYSACQIWVGIIWPENVQKHGGGGTSSQLLLAICRSLSIFFCTREFEISSKFAQPLSINLTIHTPAYGSPWDGSPRKRQSEWKFWSFDHRLDTYTAPLTLYIFCLLSTN